jgi:hypothetical protein
MRTALNLAALAVLIGLWLLTACDISGSRPLPDRIPMHFDAAGRANGWGSRAGLWLLPSVATGLYLLMSLVERFPSAFHFPVRVTRENRSRLEQLALAMIAWLKVELVSFLAWIQLITLRLARAGQGTLSTWFVPLTLGVVFFTIGWHIFAMVKAGEPR